MALSSSSVRPGSLSYRAPSPGRNLASTSSPTAPSNPATGIVPKGTFSCEARCMCPSGRDLVWVGERSGLLTVRCARTGKVKQTLQPSTSKFIFATCMTTTPLDALAPPG